MGPVGSGRATSRFERTIIQVESVFRGHGIRRLQARVDRTTSPNSPTAEVMRMRVGKALNERETPGRPGRVEP
jgi:hypothetical protein